MLPLLGLTAFLGLTGNVAAQSETIWASVVYTLYGEKVPTVLSGTQLTPLGAQQLYDAGSFIRDRNVNPTTNASSAPIIGIDPYIIDNSQMNVWSTSDEYISGSAMAFMQGLYPGGGLPPMNLESQLANGTYLAYPASNYQYPNINAVGQTDINYIWLAGNKMCANWELAMIEESASESYETQDKATYDFYQSLATGVFAALPTDTLFYANAWSLYEYAAYQYNHNTSNPISDEDLAILFTLASQQQFDYNSPSTFGTIPAIAGATFASEVLGALIAAYDAQGTSNKLTLLFGSFEPFLAFFALSNLSTGPSAGLFNSLPLPGSIMSFEIFSSNTSVFPSQEDLFVRFLFRNGTNSSTPMYEYALFGNPNAETEMTFQNFQSSMQDIALTATNWCRSCGTSQILFCDALLNTTTLISVPVSSSDSNSGISAAIGGVIGAAVTLAVLLLAILVLGLVGWRIEWRGKERQEGLGVLRRSGSGNGGFKGKEKLASDTDLAIKNGVSGVKHERVGSWELNDGNGMGNKLDKDIESGGVVGKDWGRRSEDRDDHVDPFGDPVKAVDQV